MNFPAFADTAHPITWPEGNRAAASFTFDVDAESCTIAHDPQSTRRMSLMTHQSYGPKVAVPRILQILERQQIQATFFVPGFTAECYPDVVRRIADGAGVGPTRLQASLFAGAVRHAAPTRSLDDSLCEGPAQDDRAPWSTTTSSWVAVRLVRSSRLACRRNRPAASC